jgi:hypothetical protein
MRIFIALAARFIAFFQKRLVTVFFLKLALDIASLALLSALSKDWQSAFIGIGVAPILTFLPFIFENLFRKMNRKLANLFIMYYEFPAL